jgi:hypothetical protein
VTVKDKHKLRNQEKPVRLLRDGESFGEIGAIYRNKRSCNVISANFTTLGRITLSGVNELFIKYPYFKWLLIERIKEYDDFLKLFFEKALNSVDYIEGLKTDTINDIIFSLVPEYHEKGSYIFK